MPRGGFDTERAAQVLVDAITLGDKTAADRHKVSEKTVQRYRARLKTDAKLSELVLAKGREAEHGWHFARSRFLRRALEKLDKMVEEATAEQFPQVIEALRTVGELEIAREALGVSARDHQQGQAPAAPPSVEPSAGNDGGTGTDTDT